MWVNIQRQDFLNKKEKVIQRQESPILNNTNITLIKS